MYFRSNILADLTIMTVLETKHALVGREIRVVVLVQSSCTLGDSRSGIPNYATIDCNDVFPSGEK